MRLLLLPFVLSFLISPAMSKNSNCLIVMVGGGKEWLSLLPTLDTDISINVDKATKKEAARTGCRIISGQNQDPAEFKRMIEKASGPPYYQPGTTVHFSFTDHGSPQPENRPGTGSLYIGNGHFISNKDFAQVLKDKFPKGSRMTFATSICWGSISEAVTAFKLDDQFDMCGSSSTHPSYMSYNARELSRTKSGEIKGPYPAVGMAYTADKMEEGATPSVLSFHKEARKGDIGNLHRFPGFTSSMTYAVQSLHNRSLKASVDENPLALLFNSSLDQKVPLSLLKREMLAALDFSQDYTCSGPGSDESVMQFLKSFSVVYKKLMTDVPSDLPSPYKDQAIVSHKWLETNHKKLAQLISNYIKVKTEFWEKNKTRGKDPKESAALKAEWASVEYKVRAPLQPYLFHMRNMQEVQTIAGFLSSANKDEKKRFERFVKCESRPVL